MRPGVGGAVPAEHEQSWARVGRRRGSHGRRHQVALARQELADRGPVPGPAIRVPPESGLDRQVSGVVQADCGKARPGAKSIEQPEGPQPARGPLHAGDVTAQGRRHADDRDLPDMGVSHRGRW